MAHVQMIRGAEPRGDAVCISIDADGTRGSLNVEVLQSLGLPLSTLPRSRDLKNGYRIVQVTPQMLLCYIVTVGTGLPTRNALYINLARCFADLKLKDVRSLWIPLMGTGAGQLSNVESLRATIEAFAASPLAALNALVVTISPPRTLRARDAAALRKIIASAFPSASDQGGGNVVAGVPVDDEAYHVMDYATRLFDRSPGPPRQIVTTSLLMFALAESAESLASAAFGRTLKEAAGAAAYEAAWKSYFDGPLPSPNLMISEGLPAPKLSPNVTVVLESALAEALEQQRKQVFVEDIVTSLLVRGSGRFRDVLKRIGIEPAQARKSFVAMLDRMRREAQEIRRTFLNDRPTSVDQLHYTRFAKAIADFLSDDETDAPLSVSIQAPWGAGKSTLMRLIRKELDPIGEAGESSTADDAPVEQRSTLTTVLSFLNRKEPRAKKAIAAANLDRRLTIWFNAWKYENSEQVWAGLVDAIVTQISDRLGAEDPVARELFLLRLNLARIDDGIVRRKIYERIATFWYGALLQWALPSLAVAIVGGTAAASIYPQALPAAFGLPVVAAAVSAAATYLHARAKAKNEPAHFSLAEYLRVPDYRKSVGVVHEIHHDLQRVLRVIPRTGEGKIRPLVIFVDDLDRCSPSKVAGVVEGINMFLASDLYQCMFVIGMDPQMVAAALEQAHKDVRERLPSYESTVPLGWRFMDKFVQLPFTVPPTGNDERNEFIADLLAQSEEAPDSGAPVAAGADASPNAEPGSSNGEAGTTREPAPEPQVPATVVEPYREIVVESENVLDLTRSISRDLSANPRDVKRLVNMVRFSLFLRASRSRSPAPVPELEQYRRWIALSLRWPDMMRWLQWGAEQRSPTAGERADTVSVTGRLHRLEVAAKSATDLQSWQKNIAAELGVDATGISWLQDLQLLAFFQNEANLGPEHRLSAGANIGFY